MSSTNRKLTAVIGATGQQGCGVVRALQASQFKVRALIRNPRCSVRTPFACNRRTQRDRRKRGYSIRALIPHSDSWRPRGHVRRYVKRDAVGLEAVGP